MKKKHLSISLIFVAILTLGFASFASAQETDGTFDGFRGQGPRGMKEDNPIHDLAIEELAKAFNISTAELESRLNAGEYMLDIASEFGYEAEAFHALMNEIHITVTETAVSQGLITQEQANIFVNRQAFGIPGSREQMGIMSGNRGFDPNMDSPIHDYMATAIAEALGITVEQLDAAHETGTPMHEFIDLGFEEMRNIMDTARDSAIEKALADGVITEDDLGQFGNGSCQNDFDRQDGDGYPGRMHSNPGSGMFGNGRGN